MRRNIDPPRFILSACDLLHIAPEIFRAAKHGSLLSHDAQLPLDQLLHRFLGCLDASQITTFLTSLGYLGSWNTSCQTKLHSIVWIIVHLHFWRCHLASNVDIGSFVHISVPRRCQYFPMYTIPSETSTPIRSHAQIVALYGSIVHKLRYLQNLEKCRLKLLCSLHKLAARRCEIGINQVPSILSLLSMDERSEDMLNSEYSYAESLRARILQHSQEDETSFLRWLQDASTERKRVDVSNESVQQLNHSVHNGASQLLHFEHEAINLFFQALHSLSDSQNIIASAQRRLAFLLGSEPTHIALGSPNNSMPISQYRYKTLNLRTGRKDILLELLSQHRPRTQQSVAQALANIRQFHAGVLKKAGDAALKYSPYDVVQRDSTIRLYSS